MLNIIKTFIHLFYKLLSSMGKKARPGPWPRGLSRSGGDRLATRTPHQVPRSSHSAVNSTWSWTTQHGGWSNCLLGELGEASPRIWCFSFTLRDEQKIKKLEGRTLQVDGGTSNSLPCWNDSERCEGHMQDGWRWSWDQIVKGLEEQWQI